MKTINILKTLINILFVLLIGTLVLGGVFIIAVLFFDKELPFFLQGYTLLFKMFDWKLFLIPFTTVLNFIVFVVAVFYLRKCIQPFKNSDFYSPDIIVNLKRSGFLFVFIGISTVVFRIVGILLMQGQMPVVGGVSSVKIAGIVTSTLDLSVTFLIIIGLFFLLFSKAFENAKDLKQENDLTI